MKLGNSSDFFKLFVLLPGQNCSIATLKHMKCYFILLSVEQKKNLLHFTGWSSVALPTHFCHGAMTVACVFRYSCWKSSICRLNTNCEATCPYQTHHTSESKCCDFSNNCSQCSVGEGPEGRNGTTADQYESKIPVPPKTACIQ